MTVRHLPQALIAALSLLIGVLPTFAQTPPGQLDRALPNEASPRAAEHALVNQGEMSDLNGDRAAEHALVNQGEMSDLNGDRTVDALDLDLFATTYLGQDAGEVNWCSFHSSASSNPRFFRKYTSANPARFTSLLKYIERAYSCPQTPRAVDMSDLNEDGKVDLDDLALFSTNYLDRYWETVDWCLFYEATIAGEKFEERRTKYYLEHFQTLLRFINDHFACDAPPPPASDILLENTPQLLARMATPGGSETLYYVTDPRVGSVFILDGDLVLTGEIKGLDRPLGVALDSRGHLLVGNDGRDNVEVYDPSSGALLGVFGEGDVRMPIAITVDELGDIYVTDALSHNIKVFDPYYAFVRMFGIAGEGSDELYFPIDVEVLAATGEVFVADQGNKRIQVYDLEGNWTRSIYYFGSCGWRGCTLPPFAKVQALDFDALGRLHVLDTFNAMVMLFNPETGAYLGSYGQYGEGDGYLVLPADVLVGDTNDALVTSGDGDRIEVYPIP